MEVSASKLKKILVTVFLALLLVMQMLLLGSVEVRAATVLKPNMKNFTTVKAVNHVLYGSDEG